MEALIMYDIRNLNIWKPEENKKCNEKLFLNADITELNLGVRAFNCLKRAGCNTVQDVLNCMGEEGEGLRKIRNLGARSENEIKERIEEYREYCSAQIKPIVKKSTIIKPAKRMWDKKVDEFHISKDTLCQLNACGIFQVGDLYEKSLKAEPGWYVVRELFEMIPSSSSV